MLMIRVISSATLWRRPTLGAILLVCALLSGCGAYSARDQTGDAASTSSVSEASEPYQPDPILFFVGSANDNEKGQVLDPTTGEEVQVFAGRTYNAASGRLCRRYRITGPTESSPHTSDLACRDHSGQWQKIRPLLNLDNSRILTTPK
jgi:uncharacterized SAM-binding protein YcdF (DUF218 family)